MTRETLLALAANCEKASRLGEASGIIAAHDAMFVEPDSGYNPRLTPSFGAEWSEWTKRMCAVKNLVQAGAHIDAALLLVPADLFPTIDFVTKRVWIRDAKGFDVAWGEAHGFAATVPLSICAAALRARAACLVEGEG